MDTLFKKESAKQLIINSLTLSVLFFLIEVFTDVMVFQLQNILPYFVSALFATTMGMIYVQLIGTRFHNYQFLASVIPAVLFSVIVSQSGLSQIWILHELTLLVAFMVVVFNSHERMRIA